MDTVLQTSQLTKAFGSNVAVNNVSMCIKKGEIYGFIGRNGAGKTTFMRTVLGMAKATSGTVSFFGGESRESACKKIGCLIETPGLYTGCTAYENMKRFSITAGGSDSEIKEILEFVGLGDVGRKKVKKFSLGMKQRLGIAIAMIGNPEFMILDEPVNGLDPAGMKEVRDLIVKLNREKNITFLISSHLLDELSKMATKYGIVNKGVLIEEFTPAELASRCQSKLKIEVNDPIRAVEILSGTVPQSEISTYGNTIILTSHTEESAEINSLLAKNDIMVSKIEQETASLERYFMERIGE